VVVRVENNVKVKAMAEIRDRALEFLLEK